MTPRRKALITLLKLCDLATVTACLIVAVAMTTPASASAGLLSVLEVQLTLGGFLFVGAYLVAWHFVLKACGLYRSYRLSPASRELSDLTRVVVIAIAPLLTVCIVSPVQYLRLDFVLIFGGLTLVALGSERRVMREAARHLRSRGRNLRDVVIVGDGAETLTAAARLAQRDELGYRVVEVIPASKIAGNGNHTRAEDVIARLEVILAKQPIDEVFLALPLDGSQPLVRSLIALCEEQGVTARVVASLAVLDWGRVSIDTLGGQPVLTISTGPQDTLALVAKRQIDIAVAIVGLILLSPLFLIIALAVKLSSEGPVFFVQDRVGLNRRHFRTYKFRTMVVGAEELQADLEPLNEAQGPVFKIQNDPRVTRLGKWLRQLSLDELPQLINVFLGDMSLVGPRPLPIRDVSRIDVRWHKRRFSVRPGITCLWQVNRREPKFDEWIQADMEYIDNWSLALDLKILARTFPAVITGLGAH